MRIVCEALGITSQEQLAAVMAQPDPGALPALADHSHAFAQAATKGPDPFALQRGNSSPTPTPPTIAALSDHTSANSQPEAAPDLEAATG